MVIVPHVESGARDVPLVGVHAKGRVAAEFVSIARYAMFSQGYWHHAVRAMKAMLGRAVHALVAERTDQERNRFQSSFVRFVASLPEALYAPGPSQTRLFDDTLAENSIEALPGAGGSDVPQLAPTDVAVLRWFRQHLVARRRPEAVLIEGLLRRQLFKRLWVVSRDMQPTRWDDLVGLWEGLSVAKRFEVAHALEQLVADKLGAKGAKSITAFPSDKLEDEIVRRLSSRIPWLLVDVPLPRPGSEIGLYYVLEGQRRQLRKDDKVAGSVQESDVWKEYAGNLLAAAGKVRVFCDPVLVDAIEASVEWEEGVDLLLGALHAAR